MRGRDCNFLHERNNQMRHDREWRNSRSRSRSYNPSYNSRSRSRSDHRSGHRTPHRTPQRHDRSRSRGDETCKNFQFKGSCHYGESCKFKHVSGSPRSDGTPRQFPRRSTSPSNSSRPGTPHHKRATSSPPRFGRAGTPPRR
jgi:hypothetical protein